LLLPLLPCMDCAAAQADGAVHDAELGRVVQPWSGTQVESLARAWLRYGPDRLDKLAEVRRLHACGCG
jgi:uncharacterized membrane protein YebE (DUF533 family)